jgi:hypothetical protein
MIVLFVVVLVSIVGTAMLSSTTYGLQNVVKTTKEQEEFYRAEGALEIVLTEMANYKNASTGNSGPFAYLKDLTNNTKTYQIGGKNVLVKIKTNRDISKITPSSSKETITVTLEANYEQANQTKLTRSMTFDVKVSSDSLTRTTSAYGYVTPGHFIDKEQFDEGLKAKIIDIDYNQIINALGIKWNEYTNSIDKQDIDKNEIYTFPKGITKLSEINLSGAGVTIVIPKGAIVYAKTVSISGSGNADSQFTIDGALIAETINHKGNSVMTLNSGLIAKTYNGTSNRFVVNGRGEGIECSDLPSVCSIINRSVTNSKYTSNLESTTIKFSTNR